MDRRVDGRMDGVGAQRRGRMHVERCPFSAAGGRTFRRHRRFLNMSCSPGPAPPPANRHLVAPDERRWSPAMKKFITIIAALSAIGLATPAAAQNRYGDNGSYGYANGYGGMQARTEQLRQRFQIGIQRGTISRQEAGYLRDGFRQLNRLERQYGRDGLNRYERRTLQQHIQQLRQQIQVAERSRGNGYGRDDDRDGRDGRDWSDGRGDRYDRDDRNDGD